LYDLRSCEATGLKLAGQLTHDIEAPGRRSLRESIGERRLDGIGGQGARDL